MTSTEFAKNNSISVSRVIQLIRLGRIFGVTKKIGVSGYIIPDTATISRPTNGKAGRPKKEKNTLQN